MNENKILRLRIVAKFPLIAIYLEDVTHIIEYKNDFLRDQLEQAMEANFSHESLTPLNNIINNSKIIHNDLKGIKDTEPVKMDKKVYKAIN